MKEVIYKALQYFENTQCREIATYIHTELKKLNIPSKVIEWEVTCKEKRFKITSHEWVELQDGSIIDLAITQVNNHLGEHNIPLEKEIYFEKPREDLTYAKKQILSEETISERANFLFYILNNYNYEN